MTRHYSAFGSLAAHRRWTINGSLIRALSDDDAAFRFGNPDCRTRSARLQMEVDAEPTTPTRGDLQQ